MLKTLDHLFIEYPDLSDKTIIMRADLNVPISHGKIVDYTRIERTIPTIKALQEKGAKIVIISHFGRPVAGFEAEFSLAPIADALQDHLKSTVSFGVDCTGSLALQAVEKCKQGGVVLLENLRFQIGERQNDASFAKDLASLGDIYVNDAFSCSHRAHASIVAITDYLPSFAGRAIEEEISHLSVVLETPESPVAAIIGGSKVSTKINILQELSKKMDHMFIGGGMANSFLYARGVDIGKSLCEKDLHQTAIDIMNAATDNNCQIHLPVDAVVAKEIKEKTETRIVALEDIASDEMILDVGPNTINNWRGILETCNTLVWNGPLGVFETTPFDVGSLSIAQTIAYQTKYHNLTSVAGGGDVLASLSRAGLRGSLSYVSTAGGAFLEWLEGKELPGIQRVLIVL